MWRQVQKYEQTRGSGTNRLTALGYRHKAVAVRGDHAKTDKHLPMIHITFGNLDAWLLGTHHGVSSQHLQAYLNEFVFRFNRRFWPMVAFDSLLGIAVRTVAPTYAGLYEGYGRTMVCGTKDAINDRPPWELTG